MRRLLFTPQSAVAIEQIFIYTADTWGYDQAKRYDQELETAFQKLAAGTLTGLSAESVRSGYRRLPVGKHAIYFRITENNIEIVDILHQQMDIDSHL